MVADKHLDELNGQCSWCGKRAIWQESQEPPLNVIESDFVLYREACREHKGFLHLWASIRPEHGGKLK